MWYAGTRSSLKYRPRLSLLFAIPLLLGCSNNENVGHSSPDETETPKLTTDRSDDQIDCGNLVAIAALGDFANLIRSIAQSDGGGHFKDQRLYAEEITLVRKGQTTRLTREDLGSHLGTLPSRKDWLAIASEIEGGATTSGGWRGCFVSDGKAAFVADSSGNIGLTAFDFDRQWQSR